MWICIQVLSYKPNCLCLFIHDSDEFHNGINYYKFIVCLQENIFFNIKFEQKVFKLIEVI